MQTDRKRKKEKRNSFGRYVRYLLCKGHHLLDLGNGFARVQALGTGPGAVEDGMATVHAHAVVQSGLALGSTFVAGVNEPSVGLQEDGGTKVLFGIPPV
jgi:hypothetical protein